MIRRIGNVPEQGRIYKSRPGAYAILPLKQRVLLTAQFDPEPDIQIPGGGVDPGESQLQALHREVLEEIGWRISQPRRLGAFREYTYMPEYDLWAEKLCHVYIARPVRQIAEPTEAEHATLVLSPQEAIREVRNPGTSHFLSQLFRLPVNRF